MIQPHHGYVQESERTTPGERLETAGRILGIAVAVVLMVGGLVLSFSIFHTLLGVVKDPSVLETSQQEWRALLSEGPMIIETTSGTIDLAPLLAMAVMGGIALLLVHIAIQVTLTGGRILPLVLGERKAIKTMLRETMAAQRERAEAPADEDGAAKPPRLKF